MPSFGRMIQSLCSLRIQDSAAPLERNGSVNRGIRHVLRPEPDLSSMLENFAGSFKGLPQEIVDEILDYLVDYRRTLVACSLTCKGLFRSTRRIIHRRLYIVGPGRANTSDGQEIRRSETVNRSQLHLLSTAARCGLTWYTRELTIRIAEEFTPNNLLPHLPQFQAFTRLTSITLYHFDPTPFLPVFEQYFGHLALQMRSLEFIYPPGPQDDMMYFISQFPNLEDLRFDSFPQHNLNPSKEYNISTIRSSPTLGGTLRVTSANAWRTNSLKRLTQLPSGLRFRSIELLRCTEIDPNIMIRECASTLQSLTHVFHTYDAALAFDLSVCSHLQVFELRLELAFYAFSDIVLWSASVISTITSPVFSRFVLVVGSGSPYQNLRKLDGGGIWEPVDRALLHLSQRTGMKMVIKKRILYEIFCNVMRSAFPLLVSAGALEFETH